MAFIFCDIVEDGEIKPYPFFKHLRNMFFRSYHFQGHVHSLIFVKDIVLERSGDDINVFAESKEGEGKIVTDFP